MIEKVVYCVSLAVADALQQLVQQQALQQQAAQQAALQSLLAVGGFSLICYLLRWSP